MISCRTVTSILFFSSGYYGAVLNSLVDQLWGPLRDHELVLLVVTKLNNLLVFTQVSKGAIILGRRSLEEVWCFHRDVRLNKYLGSASLRFHGEVSFLTVSKIFPMTHAPICIFTVIFIMFELIACSTVIVTIDKLLKQPVIWWSGSFSTIPVFSHCYLNQVILQVFRWNLHILGWLVTVRLDNNLVVHARDDVQIWLDICLCHLLLFFWDIFVRSSIIELDVNTVLFCSIPKDGSCLSFFFCFLTIDV